MNIMWESSRSSLELYLTKWKDKVKRPFGLVVGGQVITKTNAKAEAHEYFVIKNDEFAVKTKRKKKSDISTTKKCQKLGKNERIENYFRQELSD